MDRPLLKSDARIGILNRGEAAFRFVRAVRDYNACHGTFLETVAFYVKVEEEALFVEEADQAYPLSRFGNRRSPSPYLDRELMVQVLDESGCSAAWAGWGFLSEDAALVSLLEEKGLLFLGPSSRAMALLGDKIAAKELAHSSGVPVLPWSREPVESLQEAGEQARAIGYPCIIKAAAAGGGRGIRPVKSPDELPGQFQSALEEARRITGEGRLFIEALVERARHLEVQILADRLGNVMTFGVRDCSVQRKNQKIIEETPPPGLPEELLGRMESSAAALVRAAGYESAGTVEFLYDLDRGEYTFMEVNTRLQVEHTITEEAYGVDLVQGQIDVAFGRQLPVRKPSRRCVAVEARLNAEDPERDFSPAPGRVLRLRLPSGPGVRVDSGIQEGGPIPPEFDSMIAKIIASAAERPLALARLQRALRELQLKIEGGTSNRAFLLDLLDRREIKTGGVHTRFVEQLIMSSPQLIDRQHWEIAVLAAGIEQYRLAHRVELANFQQQLASGGYPRHISVSEAQKFELSAQAQRFALLISAVAPHSYHLRVNDRVFSVQYRSREQDALLQQHRRRYRIQTVRRADALQVEVNGVPYLIELDSGGLVRAPSPALVLSVAARTGREVERGEVLLALEAMKMEMIVAAPDAGLVQEILVRTGEQVAAGQPLLRMEPRRSTEDHRPAEQSESEQPDGALRLFQSAGPDSPGEIFELLSREYLAVLLGYDSERSSRIILEEILSFDWDGPEHAEALARLLFTGIEIFVAVERLFFSAPVEAEQLTRPATYQELLSHYFRRQIDRGKGLPELFLRSLRQALRWYPPAESSVEDENDALLRIYKSHAALEGKQALIRDSIFALQKLPLPRDIRRALSDRLDEVAYLSQLQSPSLSDAAIQTRYQLVDRSLLQSWSSEKREKVGKIFDLLDRYRGQPRIVNRLVENLVNTGHHLLYDLAVRGLDPDGNRRAAALEILSRRFTRDRDYREGEILRPGTSTAYRCRTIRADRGFLTIIAVVQPEAYGNLLSDLKGVLPSQRTGTEPDAPELIILVPIAGHARKGQVEKQQTSLLSKLAETQLPVTWAALGVLHRDGEDRFFTFHHGPGDSWAEDMDKRGFNPRIWRELRVYRLGNFEKHLLHSSEWVQLLYLRGKDNPRDERFFALVEVPSARVQFDEHNRIQRMVALEDGFMEAVYAIRAEQARRQRRLYWNRIIIHVHTVLNTTLEQNRDYAARLAARSVDLGLERIVLYSRRPRAAGSGGGGAEEVELIFENISGTSFTVRGRHPSEEQLLPMDTYVARVVRARQRGVLYPYEIIKMLTRPGVPVKQPLPRGEFEEFDISINKRTGRQSTFSVKGRPPGENTGNVVFGIITNYPDFRPEGMDRVLVLADPTGDMGSLAEAECRRIIAALDLAESQGLPLEWLPVSAGARIEMDSGTENLDWTARVLRRIISFTQAGGQVNIIIAGINIGAQSYWNAEATMLMHTRGVLIMSEEAGMLLTGKKALDFSGSVSAEDNVGIGGAEKIMGPNGQAQIRVKNLYEAYMSLFLHYELSYHSAAAAYPPAAASSDPAERDVGREPYQDNLGQGFSTIADIFSSSLNPERKKPFDMRQLMRALVDRDSPVFERWSEMKDAEIAIVWEARIGGLAVGLIGIESKPLARIGEIPHDGPEVWTGGTLFPLSSKKIARAINAFSRVLPLVILANLSGFDGSPESLRKLQLEYGAEIGRAVANFQGPIIFVVTARYHGGAYVVFSKALNENLHILALEGAFASVIGGAPAAAVVFSGRVVKETNLDPRIVEARTKLSSSGAGFQRQFDELFHAVHAEKRSALARQFDSIHSVQRARQVGSIDEIITLAELRPHLIRKVTEGMKRFSPP
ncbi:MAG: ATP-grasp domain-containing protein [Spirochaetales bacterium]|nr:ATP-grasp domain-containing protein [Spirochaetales bacterium]